jgi:DNA primase large subunit
MLMGKDSIGVLAADGTIYWTEGNIGVNLKHLRVGDVVDVFYKMVPHNKYPVVVWVEKRVPKQEVVEEIVLSEADAESMLEAIEDPPEPNDALKDLMRDDDE